MSRLRILNYCLVLFVAYNLHLLCLSDAADDQRQVYIVYMGGHRQGHFPNKIQEQHMSMLQEVVDDRFLQQALVRSYTRSFNGFAAYLTHQEQQKLASYGDVVSVFPNRILWPQTTRSWDFMGFPENVQRSDTTESNIVIGVLDSGIWPESESFNDTGFGPIPKKWKGVCKGGEDFACNKKLIGARYYDSGSSDAGSARDHIGHGTHTASTAAGIPVKDASFYGIAQGTARGAVPLARIAAYKVCYIGGCPDADILAAFDDAIADGVDIITISLGSSVPNDMKYDSIAIGALHAMEKGILTVHSAGNNGFLSSSVSSVAPWLLTVGASTTDRGIVDKVALGNGKTIVGKAVNSFKMNGTEFPIVYGKDVTSTCNERRAKLCGVGCLDSNLVSGKIVVCDTEDVREALNKSAAGVITRPGLAVSFIVPLPASALSANDMELVKSYLNSAKVHKANISTSESIKNIDAPVVATFSSKGPNPILPDLLKPDITAPGVEILAANSPIAPVTNYPSDKRSVKYKILSGTSMACPHAAGAAAYVKSYHPDWSPSAIKSALMTTAWRMDPKKNVDAEFQYGSGHINPVNATNPGLVYETSKDDYVQMLCGIGYGIELIRKLFKDNSIKWCSKATKTDLNYPSMSSAVKTPVRPVLVKFTRTVTNVGLTNSTYKAEITTNPDCDITVEPSTLSFKKVNEKQSFVVTVKAATVKSSVISASLVWSDGVHFVRSPIIVYDESLLVRPI